MDKNGKWKLSPAYDFTFSYDPSNKWLRAHQMTVNGKYSEIGLDDLIKAGASMGIREKRCKDMINEVNNSVTDFLSIAENVGIKEKTAHYIDSIIEKNKIVL